MPKRALVQRRPWLLVSILAAIAYYALRDAPVGGLYLIGIKGAAVGMLAVYALLRHARRDATILTVALALAACGDVMAELDDIWADALFLASHLVALALYLHNRRDQPSGSQRAAGLALLLMTPAIAYTLAAIRPDASHVALYALALGAMAGAAWTSRFPRYRVGIDALLLVTAKLLLIAGNGPLLRSAFPDLAIWPLYYAGQLLICTGVIQTLRRDHQA